MILMIKAFGSAIAAFFRAQDKEEGLSVRGFPHLEGWSRLENPYDRLFASARKSESKKPAVALVFMKGKRKGEVVYLDEGTYAIGRGCTNDIVVQSEEPAEQLCVVTVGSESNVATSISDTPVQINAAPVESGDLVDHDFCEIKDIAFFFMDIRGEHAIS